MRKTICLLIAGGLIGLFGPSMSGAPASAAEHDVIEWHVSMWGPLGARVWPIQWWAEEMEKRTDGRFKVILHPGAELAPPKEQLDGIRAGLYDMAHFAALYHPGKTPLAMIFSNPAIIPLGLKEIAQLELAFMEHPAAQKLMADRWNARYMGLSHTRPNYTFLGNKPIRSLKDLDGQRLRLGGKTGELFRQFGGVPTMMPAPEIYEGLSRGILDQSYLAPASHYGYNIHEVSDYFTHKVGAGSGMLWSIVGNKDSWEALPKEIQETHNKLAKELMLERLPQEMSDYIEGTIFPAWEKKGIEFIEFSAEDRAKLIAKAKPMWEEWADELEDQGLPGKEVLSYVLEKREELEQ